MRDTHINTVSFVRRNTELLMCPQKDAVNRMALTLHS